MKKFTLYILSVISSVCVKLYRPFSSIDLHRGIILFTKLRISKSNSLNVNTGTVYKSRLTATGFNNSIEIHGRLIQSKLDIIGSGNTVRIMDGVEVIKGIILVKGNNLDFIINENTTSLKGVFILMGKNSHIKIGKECMLAEGTNIWASDTHPIYENTNLSVPVNPSTPIEIGDHVWLGKDSAVLKGTSIGHDAIIGMKSVVTKDVPNGCIVAGNPARQIKSGMTWCRNHITI